MLEVVIATIAAAAVGLLVYVGRERLKLEGLALAALRTVGLGALVLLFLNPSTTLSVRGGPPIVLLDASLSMDAAGGSWQQARDTALKLIRDGGTILRFGSSIAPFDTSQPSSGASVLMEALQSSAGRARPVVVVTDGEIEDAHTIPPVMLDRTGVVLLPRDTVPNAALQKAAIHGRVNRNDSVAISVSIATWGSLDSASALLTVSRGERILRSLSVELPPSPGIARRTFFLAPRALPAGAHVLRLRLAAPGDRQMDDNERLRLVRVSEQPAVVVMVSPADWEGRFLVTELSRIVQTAVRGYALVQPGRWIDMRTQTAVTEQSVVSAARGAGLVVLRGGGAQLGSLGRTPVWRWPAASDTLLELFEGDWYVTPETPASPVAGHLAQIEWDSLPPLLGVVPLVPDASEWVALSARQGRRGAERPVLVGRDSAGVRHLVTVGSGLWRWSFRGGASREAYRTVLAAGVDWLLQDEVVRRGARLTASDVVPRGVPTAFRWQTDSVPDSLDVVISGAPSTDTVTLYFDDEGVALHQLPPGVYSWRAPAVSGARGIAVVERYSSELPLRPVTITPNRAALGTALIERRVRERWWLFVVAIVALVSEWALRQRRGLP